MSGRLAGNVVTSEAGLGKRLSRSGGRSSALLLQVQHHCVRLLAAADHPIVLRGDPADTSRARSAVLGVGAQRGLAVALGIALHGPADFGFEERKATDCHPERVHSRFVQPCAGTRRDSGGVRGA